MAGMIEVAQATVTIIPTMQGAQAEITKGLTGAAAPAGAAAGGAAGKNFASSMSSTFSKAGSTLTKAATIPIAAIGAASIAAFNEVDSGLDIIQKKTGASGDVFDGMREAMENLTTEIPAGFDEVGSAIGEVNTRFGLTGKDLERLSGQFVKFSRLNDTDISDSVDTVQKALSAFGLSAEDAEGLLDALNATGQNTGAGVDDLAEGLIQNGTAFQELGLSIEQATTLMGEMEKSGANSETVMQGLRRALKNAAKDGVPLEDALADLQDTILNGKDGVDGLTEAYELFGRSGDQIYGAVRNGTLDFKDLGKAVEDASGSVSETFESTLDPTDKFAKALNSAKIMGADLAEAVMPALSDVIETIVPIIKDVTEAWKSLPPEMQDFIIKSGAFAAAAGPLLSTAGKITDGIKSIKGAFTSVSDTMQTVSSKFGGFTGLMSTNVSDLTSTMSGKLGVAGAAVGTFMAAFSITDWLLELTGAKDDLEQFGSDIYDFFHEAEIASVDLTNSAMASFEAYAMRGEGTFEDVMDQLTAAQKAASEANTEVTRTDVETLQKYIDLMENGVAEARAKEAQARQLSNDTMVAENQATMETLQATMDAAQAYIDTGSGNLEEIMASLQAAYDMYAADTSATSQGTAAEIQAMMDQMTAAMGTTSEAMSITAETAAENLNKALADANAYLDTGKGDTEAILNNLQAAYDMYAATTDGSSQEVIDSVNEMVSKVEAASGVSISATGNLEENTVADLATISQAMSDLGITDVGQFVSAIETGLSSVQTAFGTLESDISTSMSSASSEVAKAIGEIEAKFANANFSFNQNIALPHFSMSGTFNAESGEVPSVSVSWYKRAATQGALFADPTIIGVGDASQPELLIGERTLYEQIAKAIKEAGGAGGGDIIIPVYLGGELLDTMVVRANQRHNYRSGGRS